MFRLRRRAAQRESPDVALARQWWTALALGLPAAVEGLWFGLFAEAGPETLVLYVVGTASFDPDDRLVEWAIGPSLWEPDGRYLRLPELAQLPETPPAPALEHAISVVRAVEPWAVRPGLGVAVGFDDGDYEVVHRGL